MRTLTIELLNFTRFRKHADQRRAHCIQNVAAVGLMLSLRPPAILVLHSLLDTLGVVNLKMDADGHIIVSTDVPMRPDGHELPTIQVSAS
eukprot:3909742-Pleurochrysis_carterae.AAC.1